MPPGNSQGQRYSFHLSVPGPKRKEDKDNQDKSNSWVDEDLGIHVIAVADGHGSAVHDRSDIGSLFAVQSVVEQIKQFVRSDPAVVHDESRFDDFNTWWAGRLFPKVHEDWNRRVIKDLESIVREDKRTFVDKGSVAGSSMANQKIRYGTTLLVGLMCRNLVALGQVGDGLVITAGKQVKCPLQLDVNLDHTSNETHSLCNDNPQATFKAFKGQIPPRLVFLCSDGIDDGFQSIADLKKWIAELSGDNDILMPSVFESKLKEYTKAISENSGDDATVALIFSPDGEFPEIEAASASPTVSPVAPSNDSPVGEASDLKNQDLGQPEVARAQFVPKSPPPPLGTVPPTNDGDPVGEPSDLKDQELGQTQAPSSPPLHEPPAPKEQQ